MKNPRTIRKTIWRWLGIGLFLYLCLVGYTLLSLSMPGMQSGIDRLEAGEQALPSDPKAAAALFKQAADDFHDSAARMQNSSFAVKAIALLPPFRWQIRLLKACNSLALAGQGAGSALADYPSGGPGSEKDISQQLSHASADYFMWYGPHRAAVSLTEDSLAEADAELQGIPPWVALTQKAQVEHLQSQVGVARSFLGGLISFSDRLPTSLGSDDRQLHSFLFLFRSSDRLLAGGGEIVASALLQAQGGKLTNLYFPHDLNSFDQSGEVAWSSPLSAPPSFRKSMAASPFLNETGPLISQAYQSLTGIKPEAIIMIDEAFISRLQPSRPVLGEENAYSIIPAALLAARQRPDALLAAAADLQGATDTKEIQSWSPQAFMTTTTARPPDSPNWLAVSLSGKEVAATVDITQKSLVLSQQLQQEVSLALPKEEPGRYAVVSLPPDATVSLFPAGSRAEQAAVLTAGSQEKQVSFWCEKSGDYRLTYSLPATPERANRLEFIKQPGNGQERVRASGFEGIIGRDQLLTK